ncbi:hypothetical protein B0T26DRAFT_751971 [Lasiosphaeria miniovina]|uniref:Uncharacterized protein n=1 Tax=Lasiosphaeria miniovina TaxID=1954250 RepID=A0AA40ALD8_9PEZI|nr:uncharacterized protein B0T26DRAFT_751971 [Lasiosphaeria miniovina]KAK0717983.1 hypothetical protein B0T26DRAFT_751971 [Lasiosphaeria miniovina]
MSDLEDVVYPPKEGWPCITHGNPKLLKTLGKTREVLPLLAHLPYIDRGDNWTDDFDGTPGCCPGGRSPAESVLTITEGPELTAFTSPQVFGLTCGGRDTRLMALDTISCHTVEGGDWSNGRGMKGRAAMLKDICYRQHGWPDSTHFKESYVL